MTKRKKKLEIKKWGESLIKRMDKFHGYLHRRLLKLAGETLGNSERLELLEYKNLLRDIQLFIEKDL